MNKSLSDEEVIRKYLPGQPNQCFEALYNRYVSKVYQRCLSFTHDSDQAQDFTHDIFMKVFDKLEGFQQRSSFSTWLYSVSYNYCLDQIRAAKRMPVRPLEETLAHNVPDQAENQLHEETMQLVRTAMLKLSPAETMVLRAKYEDGMSIETIAQLYDLNTSTVKMRLKRGREKIHQLCARQYAAQLTDHI